MKVIGMNKKNDKDLELIDGKMDQFIQDTGRIMQLVVMVSYFMKMEMFMKVIGKMIRLMDMESILKEMEQFIKVNGKMINSMEKELKFGVKMQNMMEII